MMAGGRHLGMLSVLLFAVLIPVIAVAASVPNSCRDCHESAQRMGADYPHFVVTQKEVELQTNMPATCPDCHLGSPAMKEKAAAHEGMGRLRLVRKKGLQGGRLWGHSIIVH